VEGLSTSRALARVDFVRAEKWTTSRGGHVDIARGTPRARASARPPTPRA